MKPRAFYITLSLVVLSAAYCVAARAAVGRDSLSSLKAHSSIRPNRILLGTISGPIGPVTYNYFHRIIVEANEEKPVCVIFTIDTPGGLDSSMRGIIKDIFASNVPIVIYVQPSGARAASAGALITLASHFAAMAPGTNIGAAHPVAIGEGKMDEEMAAKVTNDAAAYARSIAKQRSRSVEWAEQIVRQSISSTAEEALAAGVVDLIAADFDDLIENINGKSVVMNGKEMIIRTAETLVINEPPTWREKLLAKISDPNIAYLLMLLGIFGIFFELQNPGAVFPGVAGSISIILAAFALQLLPVNYTGLLLIIVSIIMFLLEIKVPSSGLLTIGGVISMLIGSLMFIDSPLPFMRVSVAVIIPSVIFTALFFLFAVGMGIRAQRRKVATGSLGIIGEVGTAVTDIHIEGSVFIHGEYWNAASDQKIPVGSKVIVLDIDGMKLKVGSHN